MRPHTPAQIEQMLAHAREFVVAGQARVLAQEARVAALARQGRERRESWNLLRIMRHTQDLQVGHVRLLERELSESGKT